MSERTPAPHRAGVVDLWRAAPRREPGAARRFARLMRQAGPGLGEATDGAIEATLASAAVTALGQGADADARRDGQAPRAQEEEERLRRAGAERATQADTAAAAAPRESERAPSDTQAGAAPPATARPPAELFALCQQLADMSEQPAIQAAGAWHAVLELQRPPVIETTLHLSFSSFALSLRFSPRDAQVRDLLLRHGALLRRSLELLFEARGAAREVVWEVD